MKRLFIVFVILIIMLFSIDSIYTQEQTTGGIIYGKDWACFVSAPDEWIMDSTSLSRHNIFALFYENGKTFSNNIPLIYINTAELRIPSDTEMRIFITNDLEDFNEEGVVINKIDLDFIDIEDAYYIYEIDNIDGKYETVVYRRYNDICFIIVLNAPDKILRIELNTKLKQVIESMKFMDKQ